MNKLKIYQNLCESRKDMNRFKGDGNYYESHHIKPRWLGGKDTKDNLVLLTAREHYIAHYLLFMHYRDKKSSAAFHMMNNSCNMKYRDSKKYEEVRFFQSENLRGENNPSKRGDVRRKISESVKGELNGMYGRTGDSNPFYGKKHSKEFLRYKEILHSNPIRVLKDGVVVKRFECVGDASKYYNCTKENIRFRLNKKAAKFGRFKGLIVEIDERN